MPDIMKDRTLLLIILFSAVYIICNIGSGSLSTWDEAIYANVSREILKTGDWIVLHQNGRAWFDKPPLYMWCTALSYKMLGINEFSTRLTSSLFGLATILLVYVFVRKIYSKNAALLASLFLTALPHYLHFAKIGMLDVMLTFFVTLMLYLFWLGQERPRYLLFSGLVFALAYMTKGFAAVTGPAAIFIYCALSRNFKPLFDRRFLAGIVFSLILICAWHTAQYMLAGREALDSYFGVHIFKRATSVMDSHTGSMNFYQKAIFNKNKPWAVIAYAGAAYMAWLALKNKDRKAVFLLSWIIAAYAVCVLVKTKLHWYIVPIYPALAMASAVLLERFFKNRVFHILLAAILIGMLAQVPLSWAFKLDYNAKAKSAAMRSEKLPYEDNGTIFYDGTVGAGYGT